MSRKIWLLAALVALMVFAAACGGAATPDTSAIETAQAQAADAEAQLASAQEAAANAAATAEAASAAGDAAAQEAAASAQEAAAAAAATAEAALAQAEEASAAATAAAESAAANAEPEGPKQLIICQAQEPDTLYAYGGSMLAASHVQASLGYAYAFVTGADFDYQPVALEKMPTIDDGAVIETVTVNPGDDIVFVDPTTGAIVTDTTTLEEAVELDQLIITYNIVEGLTWEDGTPVTAADYELSFQLYLDPNPPNPSRFNGERVAEYNVIDDTTIEVKVLPGYTPASFAPDFSPENFPPFPAHVLGDVDPAEIPSSEFARAPLSHGPYKVEEWVEGQYIRLAKNDSYWREGYPNFDEVIHKFIPDTNQLLAQLISGECDIGTEDGMDMDQSPFLLQAENEGILVANYKRGTVWEHIDFGMTSVDGRYQFFGPLGYTDLSPLDETDPTSWVGTEAWDAAKNVRKAFAHCIDRQRMIDEALYGQSDVISSFIPVNHPMHPGDDVLTTYEYDVEQGIALLEAAGWTDTDGDGFVDRNGIKFEVTINTTTGNRMREIITQVTQSNMQDCGVDVIIELLPSNEFFGDGPDGPLFGRVFDLGEFAWLTGVEPPVDLYYCDQWPSADNGWAGQNNPGYCNPAYDEAGKQAQGSIDREVQAPLFAEAQQIFSDELPVLPLFQRVSVSAHVPNLVNYAPNPTINSAMWNIWEWDLE